MQGQGNRFVADCRGYQMNMHLVSEEPYISCSGMPPFALYDGKGPFHLCPLILDIFLFLSLSSMEKGFPRTAFFMRPFLMLNQQDLEHEDRIICRSACPGGMKPVKPLLDRPPVYEVVDPVEPACCIDAVLNLELRK